MGKFAVTTFGKWEVQHQKLFSSLISNPEILSKKNKEEIKKALLDDVNSAMHEKAYEFVRQNISQLSLRNLTIQSYQISLTVVLESLSNALSIPKEILNPYVQMFCEECNQSLETMIDDTMKIGQVSVQSKSAAIEQLYGQNFKTLYPDLAQKLQLQDPEVIEVGRKNIEKTIKPADFGKNESIIREQLIYINEIATKVNSTDEFRELFAAKTGLTMEQYKNKVAASNNSLWQNPVTAIQELNVEVKKLTL